jgi:hypothetical protein
MKGDVGDRYMPSDTGRVSAEHDKLLRLAGRNDLVGMTAQDELDLGATGGDAA